MPYDDETKKRKHDGADHDDECDAPSKPKKREDPSAPNTAGADEPPPQVPPGG